MQRAKKQVPLRDVLVTSLLEPVAKNCCVLMQLPACSHLQEVAWNLGEDTTATMPSGTDCCIACQSTAPAKTEGA
jgi:hypothetical protein